MENYSLENLNIFETRALIQFLKDYINRENLSIYEGSLPRHLFLAFMKLQRNMDNYHEAMGYTE